MPQFTFELARPEDDADLRHVLAATPMQGRIAVSFCREPSWFDGAAVDGFERQVVVCRDAATGRVIGFGCRSLRELYVNGKRMTVGYLSSLRGLPEYRNRGLLARGYARFRELHQDGRTPFYLTTIADGNELALRVLTSGRAGLPAYHPAGRYHTLALPLPRTRCDRTSKSAGLSDVNIRPASPTDVPALVEFLNTVGPRRQFFPIYRPTDFLASTGLLRGLELQNILLATRAGGIVGLVGAWDQHAYRQQVVHAYTGYLGWVRPLYNLAARVRGMPGLPAPGQPLRTLMALMPLVDQDDQEVFGNLLEALRQRMAGGAWSHLLLGLFDHDPLLPSARRFQVACYTSQMFVVCWPDGDAARLEVDARPPYLELGSL